MLAFGCLYAAANVVIFFVVLAQVRFISLLPCSVLLPSASLRFALRLRGSLSPFGLTGCAGSLCSVSLLRVARSTPCRAQSVVVLSTTCASMRRVPSVSQYIKLVENKTLAVSLWAPWAKAFGNLLDFNCAMLVVPVLRTLIKG